MKHYSSNKDINKMCKQAISMGCRVESGSKHIKIYPPEGNILVISKTPRNIASVTDDFNRRFRIND